MASRATKAQLSSMFHFNDAPLSSFQNSSMIAGFSELLYDHIHMMECLPGGDDIFEDLDWQPALKHAADLTRDPRSVTWFPEHGAALLAVGHTAAPGGTVVHRNLSIVGLDNWEFKPRLTNRGSSTLEHRSVPCGASVVHFGTTREDQLDDLLDLFQQKLADINEKQGGGQKPPPRAPSTIAAALKAAKAALDRAGAKTTQDPQGGFTDVGVHGGGNPRDTAWPLVREVFQVVLQRQGSEDGVERHGGLDPSTRGLLFRLVMADFHQSLLETRLPGLASVARELNEAMEMLLFSVKLVCPLLDRGYEMPRFTERIERARETLGILDAKRMSEGAAQYRLPEASSTEHIFGPKDGKLPTVKLLPRLSPSSSGLAVGLAAAKARSRKHLSAIPSMAGDVSLLTPQALDEITNWIALASLAPGSGDCQAQQVLRTIENVLFSAVTSEAIQETGSRFAAADVPKLQKLVKAYRSVLASFLAVASDRGRMRVELRSREVLVGWAVYALAFSATRALWLPEMASYGVSLHPSQLQHLVLSDKLALDAALAVADFLKEHEIAGKRIFTLEDGGHATFSLAAKVAETSPDLQRVFSAELRAAVSRRDAHWVEVQQKQKECARLRAKLKELRNTLADQLRVLASEESDLDSISGRGRTCSRDRHHYCGCAYCNGVRNAASNVKATRSKVSTTEGLLEKAMTAKPVLQPLPMDNTSALQVVFFLHMPAEFRALSHLSFQAQQMMLPKASWDTAMVEAVEEPKCEVLWSQYYNDKQSSKYHSPRPPVPPGKDGDVMLGFRGALGKPERLVDRCSHPSDGVWHPDSLAPGCILWKGGSFNGDQRAFYFDPFSSNVRQEWVADGFTEVLPSPYQSLQWAMPQYGIGRTSSERGNVAIAGQGEAPKGMEKREYVAFGGIRAYPLLQLRKLVVGLQERTLQLSNPAVRVLLRQALFHIGELSFKAPATLMWRPDQDALFDALYDELKVRIEEIQQTPREHEAMPLLADMAAYVGDWHSKCKSLVRSSLVETPQLWAADLAQQLEKAVAEQLDPKVISALQAKQSMCFMYGVVCFSGSAALSASDVATLCKLQVLAHNRSVFTEKQVLRVERSALLIACQDVMAERSSDIVRHASQDPRFITSAVRHVIEEAPTSLSWLPISDSLACFEAEANGHHYSINLLTGTVLYDGAPPSLLPADIVSNHLYKRVFGDSQFEVTSNSSGVFRTARAVGGHFYQFYLAGEGESLVVEEIDQEYGERLELLHPEGEWGRSIPVRLRTMNSQWLCRSQRIIVLRGTSFRNHDVNFIVDCNSPDGAASCYRIPLHLRSLEWKDLLEDAEGEGLRLGIRGKLIIPQKRCPLLSVFAKFEPRAVGPEALIHLYLQPDGGLEIELPRFQLEFKVGPPSAQGNGKNNGSGVICLSHRGFELGCAQQLDGTLPDLTRYLVLCREGEDTGC